MLQSSASLPHDLYAPIHPILTLHTNLIRQRMACTLEPSPHHRHSSNPKLQAFLHHDAAHDFDQAAYGLQSGTPNPVQTPCKPQIISTLRIARQRTPGIPVGLEPQARSPNLQSPHLARLTLTLHMTLTRQRMAKQRTPADGSPSRVMM